ncbi:hypothetical protein Pst134EA_031965 [Puccinia striiformis f. sp. tritici]|uniref:uncharacterized protein n=1 Tax=Puccinia striiformis f. sp. tritici TaxID=168172 RepID=UPI002008A908|nr:uncharacterized protein Pst134EA_031965 [Puccinia striiformis f. sp. tritici]KAH9442546.1 hypothetical protein Pst134EA_031965 [Puccinia striiformis f. sp. tritici]
MKLIRPLESRTSVTLNPLVSAPASVLPSREPTADELTKFAETALKGKGCLLWLQSRVSLPNTSPLTFTSWNIDVSHMPYEERARFIQRGSSQAAAEASSGVGAGGAGERCVF